MAALPRVLSARVWVIPLLRRFQWLAWSSSSLSFTFSFLSFASHSVMALKSLHYLFSSLDLACSVSRGNLMNWVWIAQFREWLADRGSDGYAYISGGGWSPSLNQHILWGRRQLSENSEPRGPGRLVLECSCSWCQGKEVQWESVLPSRAVLGWGALSQFIISLLLPLERGRVVCDLCGVVRQHQINIDLSPHYRLHSKVELWLGYRWVSATIGEA